MSGEFMGQLLRRARRRNRRYRDSARGLPLRWMGASFGGTCPLSEPPVNARTGISISRMKEAV